MSITRLESRRVPGLRGRSRWSRHLALDTLRLLPVVLVNPASVQDRGTARPLLWWLRAPYRGIGLMWADAGYADKLVAWAATVLPVVAEIVRKRAGQSTFEELPRRWVVERTLAWMAEHRRCVRDSACPIITLPWSPRP
jgi:transposase